MAAASEPFWWYGDGPAPSARARTTATLLGPAAALYGAISGHRMGQAPRYHSRLPVVCVGNLTAGGTGKTPTTALLVARLRARGLRPAVLTRGYGGLERGPHRVDAACDTAARVGDEPLLHARSAPTVVARDRVAGAQAIEAAGEADVIVMDDGLQNPVLARTLAIAVVDGQRGLGNGRVIPAGPLRAPLADQLPFVHAVLVNGRPSGSAIDGAPGLAALARALGPVPWLAGSMVADPSMAARLAGQRVVAFAGIGRPARLFETLRDLGADVVATAAFRDHHAYTTNDAETLLALAARHRAALVTTEKDVARLFAQPHLATLRATVIALPVTLRLDAASDEALDRLLDDRRSMPTPADAQA